MTAALRPPAKAQFFTTAGLPASNHKLFTYAATTTTKISTYKDAAEITANTNPIILNSRGECDLWFRIGLSYKLVLAIPTDTDPPASPIWTVDNITDQSAGALASSTGAANIGFIQAGTGAVARTVQDKLRETVSVADYGTVGDGATNDYTALQNAINTGKDVYLPLGTYFYTTGLTVSTNEQHIFGPGILKPSGAIHGLTVQGGCVGVELELNFNSAVHTTNYAVKIANANRVRISRLHIIDAYAGLYIEQANTVTVEWMWATLRGPGIKWFGSAALRSDVLLINFALIDHGPNFYGLDWDGNCNTLVTKYLGLVCGPSASPANSYGVIVRNTSGGPAPAIGRFTHVEVDYPGSDGVNISVLTSDVDLSTCYILGATGSGLLIAATVNSREIRVQGGKFRGNTRYGIENLGGPCLYSGSSDLQSNGLGATNGLIWLEAPRINVDDQFYQTLGGLNPILGWDSTDYTTYDRAGNALSDFIGGAIIFERSANYTRSYKPHILPLYTVATLVGAVAGSTAIVTDATVTTYNSIVVGGGANRVPVFQDGAGNWRIG